MRGAHRRGARRARLRSVGVAPRRCRTGLVVKLRHPVVRGHPLHAMSTDLPIGILPLAFATAVALMSIGAWIGGDLVYRLGWRVRKAELLEGIEEGKTLAEAERALDRFEREETLLAP